METYLFNLFKISCLHLQQKKTHVTHQEYNSQASAVMCQLHNFPTFSRFTANWKYEHFSQQHNTAFRILHYIDNKVNVWHFKGYCMTRMKQGSIGISSSRSISKYLDQMKYMLQPREFNNSISEYKHNIVKTVPCKFNMNVNRPQ